MIDIDDFDPSKGDIIFRDTSTPRIKNILHNKGFWKIDETYGLELDFFLYSRGLSFFKGRKFQGNFNVSVNDFIAYLGNEMRVWGIEFKSIGYTEDKDNQTLSIQITTADGEVINYAL